MMGADTPSTSGNDGDRNRRRDEHHEKIDRETAVPAAVVGVGLLGQRHCAAYAAHPRVRLALVCDQDEQRAQEVAARFGCDWTDRYEDVAAAVTNHTVRLASVATPDFAHAAPVRALLEAGADVLCEKPLTTNLAEARLLAETARRTGRVLSVNLSNRWRPPLLSIKEAFERGELGQPVQAYYRLSDTLHVPTAMLSWAARSGPHWFLFPHSYDLVRWWFGESGTEVYARGRREVLRAHGVDAWDAIQALVTFPSGAYATFETAWILPQSFPSVVDHSVAILGTTGRAQVDLNDQGWHISTGPTPDEPGHHQYGGWRSPRAIHGQAADAPPIHHFVDSVLAGRAPLVSAGDGVAAVAMIAAVERSLASGRPEAIEPP
ncbi:MAG: Gfo/Idh/MocA family oxidoreductase [Chloroflexota bacterium]|nr:Gfo/Idh/MocA family oxidoreductase [Chloroflexota bacterium]